jgi:hypothetical protein
LILKEKRENRRSHVASCDDKVYNTSALHATSAHRAETDDLPDTRLVDEVGGSESCGRRAGHGLSSRGAMIIMISLGKREQRNVASEVRMGYIVLMDNVVCDQITALCLVSPACDKSAGIALWCFKATLRKASAILEGSTFVMSNASRQPYYICYDCNGPLKTTLDKINRARTCFLRFLRLKMIYLFRVVLISTLLFCKGMEIGVLIRAISILNGPSFACIADYRTVAGLINCNQNLDSGVCFHSRFAFFAENKLPLASFALLPLTASK